MKKDLLIEIKSLKRKLLQNEITIDTAVEQFSTLINHFQTEPNLYEEGTFYDESLPQIEKFLLEKNRKVKNRIDKLNKVLILQELGIKFNDQELQKILSEN